MTAMKNWKRTIRTLHRAYTFYEREKSGHRYARASTQPETVETGAVGIVEVSHMAFWANGGV